MFNNFLNKTINNQDKKTRIIIIISALGILVFIILAVTLPFKDQLLSRLYPKTPSQAAGTQPITGPETSFTLVAPASVAPGQEIRVSIWARSDIDAANLFVSKLKFPADLLAVTSITTNSASNFITNWIENDFDNVTGTISLIGGVPAPGYKTTANIPGLIAEIAFNAKKAGSATVSLDAGSAIYRDVDNVNILDIQRDVTFNIASTVATGTPIPTATVSATPFPTSVGSNGDMNNDGRITLVDMSVLLSRWNKTGTAAGKADINSDGVVNTFDYGMMVQILRQNGVIK